MSDYFRMMVAKSLAQELRDKNFLVGPVLSTTFRVGPVIISVKEHYISIHNTEIDEKRVSFLDPVSGTVTELYNRGVLPKRK